MATKSGIPILLRAMRVIEALSEPREHTAKSLAMELRIPPATCYRILNTLSSAHWLRREPDGTFRLSHGLALLGAQATQLSAIVALLAGPLADLANSVRLTAKVTIRDGADALMIARHEFPKDYIVSQRLGMRTPLLVGSAGAVLLSRETDDEIRLLIKTTADDVSSSIDPKRVLARVAEVRASGHTTDLGETRSFIHAISVPVFLPPLETSAALTVIGLPEDIPKGNTRALVRDMQKTARAISTALGASTSPAARARARR